MGEHCCGSSTGWFAVEVIFINFVSERLTAVSDLILHHGYGIANSSVQVFGCSVWIIQNPLYSQDSLHYRFTVRLRFFSKAGE